MAISYGVAVRNASLDAFETQISTSPKLRLYSGAIPANAGATIGAAVLLVEMSLPIDWMAAASAGSKALAGSWTGTAVAGTAAVPTFYRIWDTVGTTCGEQGSSGSAVTISTSALTAANGNVLTFAATTGVAVGQLVTGTGIVTGTTVLALTGTTVTLSHSSTAGVASAAAITFTYDLPVNGTLTTGQTISVTNYTKTDGNP